MLPPTPGQDSAGIYLPRGVKHGIDSIIDLKKKFKSKEVIGSCHPILIILKNNFFFKLRGKFREKHPL